MTMEGVGWVVSSFSQEPRPGQSGAVLLQRGLQEMGSRLYEIIVALVALGYVLHAWRKGRVTFIPMPVRGVHSRLKC